MRALPATLGAAGSLVLAGVGMLLALSTVIGLNGWPDARMTVADSSLRVPAPAERDHAGAGRAAAHTASAASRRPASQIVIGSTPRAAAAAPVAGAHRALAQHHTGTPVVHHATARPTRPAAKHTATAHHPAAAAPAPAPSPASAPVTAASSTVTAPVAAATPTVPTPAIPAPAQPVATPPVLKDPGQTVGSFLGQALTKATAGTGSTVEQTTAPTPVAPAGQAAGQLVSGAGSTAGQVVGGLLGGGSGTGG